jgi:hypothetical protein
MFISILYMFRAAMCPSSGELIVLIRHLVYVTRVQVWKPPHQTVIHTSNIYQMSYWYNQFSWWWAHDCPKYVENRNKNKWKGIVRQVGYLPIWTFGVQLWGCAKPSNTKILQRIQSKILRIAFNAPWYISNKTLHDDSGNPPVEDEIKRLTNNYIHNLTGHPNVLTSHLLALPPNGPKTVTQTWPTDVLS